MSRLYRSQRVTLATPSPAPIFRFDGEALSSTDGATVTTITDAEGGGLTLTGTGAKRGTVVQSRMGYRALKLTQASVTEYQSATGGITGDAAHTMLAVYFNRSSVSAFAPIMGYGPSATTSLGGDGTQRSSSLGLGFTTGTTLWGGSSGSGAGDGTPTSTTGSLGRIEMIAKVHAPGTSVLWQRGVRCAEPTAKTYVVSSAAFGIGTAWINAAAVPNVDLFAAAWWNSALTDAQLAAWFRWFSRRYGMSQPQRILYIGDSIAFGLKASSVRNQPPSVLQRLLARPTEIANQGHSGIKLAALATSAQVQIDVYSKFLMGPPTVAIIHAGTNDNEAGDLDGAGLLAAQAGYYTLLKNAGISTVIVHTMLKRSGGAAETNRGVFNTGLKTTPAGTYADIVIDLDVNAGLADNTSGSYDVDHVHPNDTGCAAIAALDAAVLPAVI